MSIRCGVLAVAVLAWGLSPTAEAQTKAPRRPAAKPAATPAPALAAGEKSKPKLQTVFEMGNVASMFGSLTWGLAVGFDDKEKQLTPDQAVAEFAAGMSATPSECSPECQEERRLLALHEKELTAALRALPAYVGDGHLIHLKSMSDPIHLAIWKDRTCAIFPYLGVETVLNTIKLEAKERASRIATSVGLPLLKSMASSLKGTDFGCIGVGVTFGSKNFLEEGPLSLKGEYLLMVAEGKVLDQYGAGEITDEEAVGAADTFVRDRDREFKKVRLFGGAGQ